MGNRSRSLSYPPTESIDIFKLSSPTPTRLLKPPFPIPLLPWVIPYAIAYLVHVPNTRTIRLALLPFGLVSATWCLVATDLNAERPSVIHGLEATFISLWNFSAAIRYATTHSPPTYHPLPHPPPYPRLRSHSSYRALDLLLNEFRHINISPYPPLSLSSTHTAISHFCLVFIHAAALGVSIVPLFFLTWMPAVKVYRALIYGSGFYNGLAMFHHVGAGFGIGSGVWMREEWPDIMDRPWVSSSVNELWGRRYHQGLRGFFLFATPFAFLPRAILIALIFTISAIYHALLSYPFTHTPVLTPWLILFTGSGVACVLERSFYHITGRKVGGWWGRFWTWRIMYLLSAPIVEHEFSMGIATDAPARE